MEEQKRRPVTPVPIRPTSSPTSSTSHTTSSATSISMSTRLAMLQPLLATPQRLRNVCILAHVDHGKTTLTDSLLASNGIISHKQAGKLRYLDSREDEQQRGITMESSAISLIFDDRRADCGGCISGDGDGGVSGDGGVCGDGDTSGNTGDTSGDTGDTSGNTGDTSGNTGDTSGTRGTSGRYGGRYGVNLIDSPGHVDFAGHVVTASRLCDGAVVLVDVVEGVCTQTMAVLRQAHSEHLQLALVVNKIDRLVTELRLDCQEAALCIFKLVEQVNAVYGSIDKEQGSNYFDPVHKGNVVFASATDGFAFSLSLFARLYAGKLGCLFEEALVGLWGADSSFDVKSKRFGPMENRKCAFAQLVLHNIWSVYNHDSVHQAQAICKSLRVSMTERELKADSRSVARQILSNWLPLSTALFHVFIDCLPAPTTALAVDRLTDFVPFGWSAVFDTHETLCQISKMFSVTTASGEMLVGMARLFSGTCHVGQRLYVLSNKYDPTKREPDTFHEYTVERLYLLMGRELEPVDKVHAGNVFGISGGGLETMVFKSGTLSTSLDVLPLTRPANHNAIPLLLKVAIHPLDINDLAALQHGLKTLSQADPVAETFVQANGEQVLAVAGELHLEMCLKDLKERFTDNVNFTVSDPLVPFRETFLVGHRNTMDAMYADLLCDVLVLEAAKGLLRVNLGYCQVTLRAAVESGEYRVLAQKQRCTLLAEKGVVIDKALFGSILAGFRMAMEAGPLCNEPVSDVNILVTGFESGDAVDSGEAGGRLISDFSSCCHAALLFWSPRLQLAVYKCDIQTSADFLGRVYGVLAKRRGRVICEEYNEATNHFTIHSTLPVIESFGFGHDLRSKTSGIAVPQLLFDGFELLPVDPFEVAADPDASGEGDGVGESANEAMRYLMKIRERKGMYVERRIVECADKQRTRRR